MSARRNTSVILLAAIYTFNADLKAVMAFFSFSLLDAVQKTAVIYHSVFQLLLIKYCFVLVLSFVEAKRKKNYTWNMAGFIFI